MLALLTTLFLASAPSVPPPDCVSVQGRTVCGYACRSTGSTARCAQTPFGMCTVLQGEVHCFDPPLAVIHHPPRQPAAPMCRQSGASVVCGYHCKTVEGRVACARTPYGLCQVLNGRLTCWDPSEATLHQYGASLPPAKCSAAGSSVACGYECQATLDRVACSQTPAGRCTAQAGSATCWDPPPLLHCEHTSPQG